MVFEAEHANILGGLLNIVSQALILLPNVNLPPNERPRIYEFARFGIALAEACGFSQNDFMQQFNNSRLESLARTIDAHPIAVALIEWAEMRVFKTKELSAKALFSVKFKITDLSKVGIGPKVQKGLQMLYVVLHQHYANGALNASA